MGDGAIYVARGSGYLELAGASAASLRAHEPGLAIDVFTDQPLRGGGPFDRVHPIPGGAGRDKIAAMAASRFDRTLFLDCDTLVVQPLGDLFGLLDRFELAVAHDVRRASPLVQEAHATAPPYAFPQLNTGVVLYRRSPAMWAFLADWARRYRAAGRTRDQVTFRDLVWESDIRFHVLPPEFNLRRVTLMDAWEPLDARPTIIHSHRLLQHLRGLGSRIMRLEDLLELERAALEAEWAALGLPAASPPGACPVARFTEAEARQGQGLRQAR
jgi:hypothetical protein